MLTSAAFCPHPPLLVPELAGGAAAELDGLRAACAVAVSVLLDDDPATVVVVGGAAGAERFPSGSVGSLVGFGVDVRAGSGGGDAVLPLSLTIGAWLLDQAGYDGPRDYRAVTSSGAEPTPAAGDPVTRAPGSRTAWLVLGDASACRTPKAPGSYDPRAEAFDADVAAALSSGDPVALAALDVPLAEALHVAGIGPWRALAAAWGPHPATARLLIDEAPYGVGYLVATWVRADGADLGAARAARPAR